jgi:hypothetical protein
MSDVEICTDLTLKEPQYVDATETLQQVNMFALSPAKMVARASEIATVLNDVIVKQKLFIHLNGNRHVKAPAWTCCGNMLSILPKEERVIKHEDGSIEVYVSLINYNTGAIVGGGSGFVGADEPNWRKKPEFARRSMANTRATSKAYKTCFSWIIALAGYNATPAEEMEFLMENSKQETTKKNIPAPDKMISRNAIYHGGQDQKSMLMQIFNDKGIDNPEVKKRIHNRLVEERVIFTAQVMSLAVDHALEEEQTTDKPTIEIPFG